MRVVIKYFLSFIKCSSPTEIKAELDVRLGESTSSFTTIKTWIVYFKSSRISTATTKEVIQKVRKAL